MDGTPFAIAEPTGTTEYPSFDWEGMVATEDGDVERRLADLGYLG